MMNHPITEFLPLQKIGEHDGLMKPLGRVILQPPAKEVPVGHIDSILRKVHGRFQRLTDDIGHALMRRGWKRSSVLKLHMHLLGFLFAIWYMSMDWLDGWECWWLILPATLLLWHGSVRFVVNDGAVGMLDRKNRPYVDRAHHPGRSAVICLLPFIAFWLFYGKLPLNDKMTWIWRALSSLGICSMILVLLSSLNVYGTPPLAERASDDVPPAAS